MEGLAGIHRGPGRLPRSPGYAATAEPTGGSCSRPRPGPARTRRAAPRRRRSALTLAQARAPPATLAPLHPAPHWRLLPLREPSLCRQPDKAPARGPLHHLPETRESSSHVAGHPPEHTHACPHTHTSPHPQAGPGANPHCCWDPCIHRHTLKVITVLHCQVTWRVPNRHGPCGGGGEGLGRRLPLPPGRAPAGWGREGSALGLAPCSAPAAGPSLFPGLPALPSALRSQPVSASDPIGVRGAVPSWPAVARCFKLCVSGPGCAGGPSVQLLPLPGHFPGRVARDKLGLDGSAEKGLPGCVC